MPPAITSDNENESEAEDIPYKGPKGKLADNKQLTTDLKEAAANGADEDDDGEAEEEYTVEKIITHAWDKGKLKFEVAWVGWEEHTWEPEENLDNCPDELDAYYKMIGGRPTFKKEKGKEKGKDTPVSATKKRKLAQDSPSATTPASAVASDRGRKKTKVSNTTGGDGNTSEKDGDEPDEAKFPSGSWEDEVKNVDTLERGDDGKLFAFIMWNDGKRTRHFSEILKRKCPLRLIDFYEAHLQFNPPAVTKAPNNMDDIIDETEVKPVATNMEE